MEQSEAWRAADNVTQQERVVMTYLSQFSQTDHYRRLAMETAMQLIESLTITEVFRRVRRMIVAAYMAGYYMGRANGNIH